MGVDAHLNRFHSQRADTLCLPLTNHDGIRLELDAERQFAGILQNLKEILAQQDFATTQSEEKDSCTGKLFEEILDLHRGHLAVIFVIEVAVNAPFIAAVRNVKVNAEWSP